MIAGIITHLGFAIFFFIVGILFLKRKASLLIAGYNTLSKREKEKYNIKYIMKFLSIIMFVFAACFCVMAGSYFLEDNDAILYIGYALVSIVVVFTIVYSNISHRFRQK